MHRSSLDNSIQQTKKGKYEYYTYSFRIKVEKKTSQLVYKAKMMLILKLENTLKEKVLHREIFLMSIDVKTQNINNLH